MMCKTDFPSRSFKTQYSHFISSPFLFSAMEENQEPPKHPVTSSSKPPKHPAITEPSKTSPKALSSIAEKPSTKNPSKINPFEDDGINKSFTLELSPASKLRDSILALSDVDFNETGTAMIEVVQKGLEITVRNKTDDLGFLNLVASGFIKFEFRRPLKRKMIILNNISEYLEKASDGDIVTISHICDSHELSFQFGSTHVTKFGVELLEIDPEFKNVGLVTFSCECIIPIKILWSILPLLRESTSKLVSVEVSDSYVTMVVGKKGLKFNYDTKKGVVRGLEPDQKHYTMFEWPYYESLQKASLLAKGVILCLVTDPKDMIMWRINLRELGDLVFMKAMTIFFPNFELHKDGDSDTDDNSDTDEPARSFEILVPLDRVPSTAS